MATALLAGAACGSDGSSDEGYPAECVPVATSAKNLMPATGSRMWDRLSIKEQNDWMVVANMVVARPECFSDENVARMRTMLQNIR